ncbi:NAD(P)H-quinone dehydrogenase [Acidipropionibacterium acidipropionici]|uniref:NAD(P)H dehydrogenase (quinone) n=1 Tax=Acidipropionibacterium acidipropionici TaxID=1748 RepID=A0AAC8YFE2_9ACTN|nr:NAD(P)H-quinone dehydrogenase [Acidipropionibacterium acidipropionici]AMS04967.1 flavoprotein disulfide reductase [Acidipropionibacterium acidipropionici]AOZ46449.1 NAD(P)H-quinone dehydrogenase [Acidipropionibacterium acidipropionici]AZP37503.1 NAD(P)H-quinone dehydrogenase [Acidipropionibacterium acidipropionici]
MTSMVIIGGGPGGYEAAMVAAGYGVDVVLVERDRVGGAAVLTDCVPSKTLIATAELMETIRRAPELGLRTRGSDAHPAEDLEVDLGAVNARVGDLAAAQCDDIAARLDQMGVTVLAGAARLAGPGAVEVTTDDGPRTLPADLILVATGTTPRELPGAPCDGERILNWKQLYGLTERPEHLIVVGSGVTGAEFASAYDSLGCSVTLVSSRDQVLPGEDPDAAAVLQRVFEERGMTVLSRSRAASVRRHGEQVEVTLTDGRTVEGSHCLMAVGSEPNTAGIGLEEAGVRLNGRGQILVDGVSRTSAPGVYAAGDCTGVLALASVAAMQGRIAVWHALGRAVQPLDLRLVASNVFTSPEIATVGVSQRAVDSGEVAARSVTVPLPRNPRAKMQGITDGFVKLFCRPATGNIIGGVVVAPHASELIHPVSIAVAERIPVDAFQHDFTVYPSISGSVSEAARLLAGRLD